MPHFRDQHERLPTDAVMMSAAQVDDLKAFLVDLIDKKAPPPAVLSDAQFEKLVSLLQPGFELSTRMLDDYKRQNAPLDHEPPPSDYLERAAEEARVREGDMRGAPFNAAPRGFPAKNPGESQEAYGERVATWHRGQIGAGPTPPTETFAPAHRSPSAEPKEWVEPIPGPAAASPPERHLKSEPLDGSAPASRITPIGSETAPRDGKVEMSPKPESKKFSFEKPAVDSPSDTDPFDE